MTIIYAFVRDIWGYFYSLFRYIFQRYRALLFFHTYINSPYVSIDSSIGKYVYIGHNTSITKATIGNYCSIASNVSIWMGEHELDKISTNSIFYEAQYAELTKKDCIIGNDVWIGVDAIIRRWITIGNGAVIGANSFVNVDIPPYAIVAGSPAKIIRYRFNEDEIKMIETSYWWKHDRNKAKNIIDTITAKIHA